MGSRKITVVVIVGEKLSLGEQFSRNNALWRDVIEKRMQNVFEKIMSRTRVVSIHCKIYIY